MAPATPHRLLPGIAAVLALLLGVASVEARTGLPGTKGLVSGRQLEKDTSLMLQRENLLRGGMGGDAPGGFVRVAFQGEPGAYSEKACRELLGEHVETVGKQSFEDAFKAVASREVDYALLPIENSLGGSIHTVYDLLLRYNLYITAEHTLRVRHQLLAPPGTKIGDVKRVMSHPQALAQCDNYLRSLGVKPEPKYDTAGSAKYIMDEGLKGCAAIASDLAGKIYGLDVLRANIEDDDNNYTRFILLSRRPVANLIPPDTPAKTTMVFLVENRPGSLYRALACFALRDIDLVKCESRPTSVQLLQYLQYSEPGQRGSQTPAFAATADAADSKTTAFRYCFYFDIQAPEVDPRVQAAIYQLREQSKFVRILGSYPSGSKLVGPVADSLKALERVAYTDPSSPRLGSNMAHSLAAPQAKRRLKIGIIGFGKFGQFLAKTMTKHADVVACDKDDQSVAASEMGVQFFPLFQMKDFLNTCPDVVLLSVSVLALEEVLRSLPSSAMRGKLVVDVLNVKSYAKQTMLETLPADCDVLCTHPMFGPESAPGSWQSMPLVYEQVRVSDYRRAADFLAIFEAERCNLIEMSAEQHDKYSASSQFMSHLLGRVLREQHLQPSPIDTHAFQHALKLTELTAEDSFDLFFALYKHAEDAPGQIAKLREAVAQVERQLASKEAYLHAHDEIKNSERQRMVAELRKMLGQAGLFQHSESLEVPPATRAAPVVAPPRVKPSTAYESEPAPSTVAMAIAKNAESTPSADVASTEDSGTPSADAASVDDDSTLRQEDK